MSFGDFKMFRVIIFFELIYFYSQINSEKITFIAMERPAITYTNSEYVSYGNVTSRRHGRNDPFYYVEIHGKYLKPLGNNVEVHFYFYEFLTNQYKRGFVEMHMKFCDFIEKDIFFGIAMKQDVFAREKCPYQPGEFHLYNMTIPITSIPKGFPFTKGRIYLNCTNTATKELFVSGYMDMEVKVFDTVKRRYLKYN